MSTDSPPASQAPARPPRRPVGSILLLAASGSLALQAIVHGLGFLTASIAIRNSGLLPNLQNAFQGLWLGQSAQAVVISGVLLLAGLRPGSVARVAILLCALLPALGGAIFGAFVSSVATLVFSGLTAVLAVAGVLLQPRAAAGAANPAP